MAKKGRKDPLIWGIILIIIGLVFILHNFDVDIWSFIARLWRLVLIIWGAWILYIGIKESQDKSRT